MSWTDWVFIAFVIGAIVCAILGEGMLALVCAAAAAVMLLVTALSMFRRGAAQKRELSDREGEAQRAEENRPERD